MDVTQYLNDVGGIANRGAHKGSNGKEKKPNNSDSANEWYYKQNEAALNQKYAIESGLIQAQLQREQWERENAYNDPSRVRQRYESAGISAQAAFGTGSASGAGIAHSASMGSVGSGSSSGTYGTSDRTQNLSSAQAVMDMIEQAGGLAIDATQLVQGNKSLSIQQERLNADKELIYQEAKSKALQNEEALYYRDNGVWKSRASSEHSKSISADAQSQMDKIRAANYDLENRADIKQKEAAAQEMLKHVELYEAEIKRIESLTDAEKKEKLESANYYKEKARDVKQRCDFYYSYGWYPGEGSLPQNLVSSISAIPRNVDWLVKDLRGFWNSDFSVEAKESMARALSSGGENAKSAIKAAYSAAEKFDIKTRIFVQNLLNSIEKGSRNIMRGRY